MAGSPRRAARVGVAVAAILLSGACSDGGAKEGDGPTSAASSAGTPPTSAPPHTFAVAPTRCARLRTKP